VLEYRARKENFRQIAKKLGVSYVLESSVRRSGNTVRVTGQAMIAAMAGEPEEAYRHLQQVTELDAGSRETGDATTRLKYLTFVQAWTGEKEKALDGVARLLCTTKGLHVHEIRAMPNLSPLHGDPRFEALLHDSKNNAPLF
jgi:hypothetical protein